MHEMDGHIRTLLTGGALAGADVEVVFDAPTRDWSARRNAPTFNVFLYDIREELSRRERGTTEIRDERGIVQRRRRPPRWFRLSYLITAWTKRPEDEHRLLSAALATLLPHEVLPPETLPGALGALGLSVPLTVGGNSAESRSLAEIWSSIGGALKPSLDLTVTVPFPAYPDYDAGPAVTEGAIVRAREMDGPLVDEDREHQPRHLTAARPLPGTISPR